MEAIKELEKNYTKPKIAAVQSGDTVRVHQLIREGNKKRIQVFEGVVIRTHRMNSVTAVITVRRIASGVGVEKTFMLHSSNVQKVDVVRRAKVRRNFLSYLRGRRGKSARLTELAFDKGAVNVADEKPAADTPTEDAPVAAVTDDDAADAEITELNETDDSIEADQSTEAQEKGEDKLAAADDEASQDDVPNEQTDPADEVEQGLERANQEDDSAQGTT